MDFSSENMAPPLPPRTQHRPLERSHAFNASFTPPAVLRQNKPKKILKLEDSFGFELIDTDEEYKSYGTASTTSSLSDADITSTPTHKTKATSGSAENGGKIECKNLIGCDNYITTVLSKSKKLGSSHMLVAKNDSQNSVDSVDGPVSSELTSNPHKPLTRQKPEIETALDDLQQVLHPKPKLEHKEVVKPHPKALHRVRQFLQQYLLALNVYTSHQGSKKNHIAKPYNLLKCCFNWDPYQEPLIYRPNALSMKLRQA